MTRKKYGWTDKEREMIKKEYEHEEKKSGYSDNS